jgi:hypothetical protein
MFNFLLLLLLLLGDLSTFDYQENFIEVILTKASESFYE